MNSLPQRFQQRQQGLLAPVKLVGAVDVAMPSLEQRQGVVDVKGFVAPLLIYSRSGTQRGGELNLHRALRRGRRGLHQESRVRARCWEPRAPMSSIEGSPISIDMNSALSPGSAHQ